MGTHLDGGLGCTQYRYINSAARFLLLTLGAMPTRRDAELPDPPAKVGFELSGTPAWQGPLTPCRAGVEMKDVTHPFFLRDG